MASEFREALTTRGLVYAVGVTEETTVWPPGQEPLPPEPWTGRGRRPKLLRRTPEHRPVSVLELAATLPAELYETVRWREGTRGRMASRFAAVRVRPAHRDTLRSTPWPVERLLIQWPEGHKEPSHYWLSTAAETAALEDLVRLVQVRWRIERARLSPPLPLSFLQAAPLEITAVYDRYGMDPEKEQALAVWGRRVEEIVGGGASAAAGPFPVRAAGPGIRETDMGS